LRSGADNYFAKINIGRLFNRERNARATASGEIAILSIPATIWAFTSGFVMSPRDWF
jgi:hypothetical protein